ncbi:hypothetical protein THASP1DRAFT_28691 [Thamnocephalis sphaerospora]|uniref:Uncharacterized protein n=1 Tax=Thamnocephalis sphaerospora TaxID=78915 RepID=A0A4P9XUA7_9FUNG|nr:hypothetical protein THASP1DRAFT_28691 [Thamnocephalis sphaerospora]|eukprot:RKP09532.1 hypothetical protein THASP1DRAFT_28691 [Thamnocephalis sphaerospora]
MRLPTVVITTLLVLACGHLSRGAAIRRSEPPMQEIKNPVPLSKPSPALPSDRVTSPNFIVTPPPTVLLPPEPQTPSWIPLHSTPSSSSTSSSASSFSHPPSSSASSTSDLDLETGLIHHEERPKTLAGRIKAKTVKYAPAIASTVSAGVTIAGISTLIKATSGFDSAPAMAIGGAVSGPVTYAVRRVVEKTLQGQNPFKPTNPLPKDLPGMVNYVKKQIYGATPQAVGAVIGGAIGGAITSAVLPAPLPAPVA